MTGYKYTPPYMSSGKYSERKEPSVLQAGNDVYHKVFGRGRVESVDADTHVCYIRFGSGLRPIDCSYQGIVKLG